MKQKARILRLPELASGASAYNDGAGHQSSIRKYGRFRATEKTLARWRLRDLCLVNDICVMYNLRQDLFPLGRPPSLTHRSAASCTFTPSPPSSLPIAVPRYGMHYEPEATRRVAFPSQISNGSQSCFRWLLCAFVRLLGCPKDGIVKNELSFIAGSGSESSLQTPFLSAAVSRATRLQDNVSPGGRTATAARRRHDLPALDHVRHGLRVDLVELGFEKPIHDGSRRTLEKVSPLSSRVSRRLSELISNMMGLRYAKIVNRCLSCDFELAGPYEIASMDVQRAFVQGVGSESSGCLKVTLQL